MCFHPFHPRAFALFTFYCKVIIGKYFSQWFMCIKLWMSFFFRHIWYQIKTDYLRLLIGILWSFDWFVHQLNLHQNAGCTFFIVLLLTYSIIPLVSYLVSGWPYQILQLHITQQHTCDLWQLSPWPSALLSVSWLRDIKQHDPAAPLGSSQMGVSSHSPMHLNVWPYCADVVMAE